MTALDELLYLHPTSVIARFAAEPPAQPKKRRKKPKRAALERRQLLTRLQIRRAAT
jgi:hypothetical protein